MTRITEVQQTTYEDPSGTPTQVVQKLVAMGWEVAEETAEHCTLRHDLIPGARRIVHLQ